MIKIIFPEYFLISILGLIGFFIASSMYSLKKRSATAIDVSTSKCIPVITSKYSRFLGGSVERLGMIYYSFVFIAYFCLSFITTPMPDFLILVLDLYAVAAFVFSLYLFGVQVFTLKKFCSWCIISSLICVFIFFLNFFVLNI